MQNINNFIYDIKSFTEKFKISKTMRNYNGYSYLLFNEKNKKINDNI